MKIIYDTMGSDHGPIEIIKGAIKSQEQLNIEPVFVGGLDEITSSLIKLEKDAENYSIIESSSVISNSEEPVIAVRRKKDSSMMVGLSTLKDDDYSGMISAGNTGALLAGSIFIVGRLDGVRRSPIAAFIPTLSKPLLLLDGGANVDVDENILYQFAQLSSVYIKYGMNIDEPKIGLLNVGKEEAKGNKVTKATYKLLKNDKDLNFIGNVEPTEVPFGPCDILVTDGFTGNILMKMYEGVNNMYSKILQSTLSEVNDREFIVKFKDYFSDFLELSDYSGIAGAPLLGLNKAVFKAHGSSKSDDIVGATKMLINFVNGDVINIIKENL